MAGIGPPPKPAGERRRRNKVVTEELELDAVVEAPALPASYAIAGLEGPVEVPFSARTIAWYRTFAASPEAQGLTPLNWLRLQDIAVLQDRWYATGDLDLQKELRLQLALFGATPADLRRTGREVKKPTGNKPKSSVSDAKSNVRKLRAV